MLKHSTVSQLLTLSSVPGLVEREEGFYSTAVKVGKLSFTVKVTQYAGQILQYSRFLGCYVSVLGKRQLEGSSFGPTPSEVFCKLQTPQ